jgi:hypothetical protein
MYWDLPTEELATYVPISYLRTTVYWDVLQCTESCVLAKDDEEGWAVDGIEDLASQPAGGTGKLQSLPVVYQYAKCTPVGFLLTRCAP